MEEVLPKHRDKFPAGSSFFVAQTERRVESALKRALRARGFDVKDNREEADLVMTAKVTAWEYNDAGFSGFYDRDEMTLSLTLERPATRFIIARHTVKVCSDFRILAKYVDGL